MDEICADVSSLREAAERLRREGASAMFLAVDGRAAGLLTAADPIKDSTPEAIAALQAAGLRIVMATGDGKTTTEAVANVLGIDEVYGEVRARQISQATVANIKRGLIFAFAHNALGVPVAASVLYPFFGLLLSPMIAALAMSLSSVSVAANALRLRKSQA